MNKDKVIEFIAQQSKEHSGPMDDYREGYFKCLEDFESEIQSEPEEKTNFDIITESPEKLAEYLESIVRNAENDNDYCISICDNFHTGCFDKGICKDGILRNLNKKVGE